MEAAHKVLVILAVVQMSAGSCPSSCTCEDSSIICSSLGIPEVPLEYDVESVKILDLSTNMIKSLRADSFLHFVKVSTLYISFNEIVDIHLESFSSMPELRELDLSYNRLQYFDPDTLSRNPRLEVLSLTGNPLVQINTQWPILISSSLRSLDLSECSLETLHPTTFRKLPNLRILDLSSNNIRKLPVESLNGLKNLRIVELEFNPWKCSSETEQMVKWAMKLRGDIPVRRPVKCVELRTVWIGEEREEKPVLTDDESLKALTVTSTAALTSGLSIWSILCSLLGLLYIFMIP